MKVEALLFGGVAVFFAGAAALYGWWSADPAGTAALVVAFLMAAVVSFFCATQYRRGGRRPQDRTDAEVADGSGPLEFFPAQSPWPLITALGFAVLCTGVVYGLWLFLIGVGVLARGVLGMVFQYADRDAGQSP
ncbi:heme/copper-type cytochrome/quinol oxidase subunit 2 [Streptomyces aurantiacus]|uniref:aa3-type cytochrome oxidase subunit IV n=1 Tax=Streptomyces aurantiacus TaxID=47760 RepID=UPI00278F4B17|nr:cytochrome c oxidase subunit 4 [Streptomyces aurantiacus]MDQ0777921.1 heme/copper-type cytochrome/quinol oxidase subunit 2 [Streptomyces aurantiacus]